MFGLDGKSVELNFTERNLVRSTNPLYTSYGIGRIQKIRSGQAKVEFNPSVFMTPPYWSENKILPVAELERVETPIFCWPMEGAGQDH